LTRTTRSSLHRSSSTGSNSGCSTKRA
jgi:hypothetical protein